MIAALPLGRTGLEVSSLGLGTAALTLPYGPPGGERRPPGHAVAARTIEAALGAGITLIDTAPAYADAEALVGAVTAGAPCVVATKLATPERGWAALDDRAVRAVVRASAERSLADLRRDRLDVLQIHNATPDLLARGTVLAALEELRADGLVGALGATVYGEAAALAAVAHGLDVVQVALSALDLRPERAVLPAAEAAGTGVVARSALLRGVLTAAGRALAGDPHFGALADAAHAFLRAAGADWDALAGLAVAFAASRPGVASVLVGPRDAGELRELLAGAERWDRRLPAGWTSELPADLLDPSRWPSRPTG